MSQSALLFDRLGSSAYCHWTAENVDHILEFGDKMNLDFLQEGLIPGMETLSGSILPFADTGLQRAAKQSACQHHKQEHTLTPLWPKIKHISPFWYELKIYSS